MLVPVDCAARPVETIVEDRPVTGGKLAAITRAHSLFLVGDRLLAMLQPARLALGQGTGIDPLLNALLLIGFTLIDAGAGCGPRDLHGPKCITRTPSKLLLTKQGIALAWWDPLR
jgi:hypothetical protein